MRSLRPGLPGLRLELLRPCLQVGPNNVVQGSFNLKFANLNILLALAAFEGPGSVGIQLIVCGAGAEACANHDCETAWMNVIRHVIVRVHSDFTPSLRAIQVIIILCTTN